MVTEDVSQWDETICDMAVCQHPQCWDTLRRIEEGHPRVRLRNSDSLCRASPETKDELPTLKIINFPSSCSLQGRIRCSNCNRTISRLTGLEPSFLHSSLYETSINDFSDQNSDVSSERTHFPGLNSVVESHTIAQGEMNFTYLNKVGNLQVMDLGEAVDPKQDCYLDSGNLTVKWVPNIHRKCKRTEVEPVMALKPLRSVCVKDLASENLLSLEELQTKGRDIDTKRKKSKKIPTGGQPYQLCTKRSPKITLATKKIKSLRDSSATRGGKPKESQIKKRHTFPRQLQAAPFVELQEQEALQQGNQRVDLSGVTEKPTCPLLGQKIPVVNLKEESLERMSNRPYLRGSFEGFLGMRCHDTKLQQQPACAETGRVVLTTKSLASCTLNGTEEVFASKNKPSQQAPAEQESQEGEGPMKQHVGLVKRRSSVMYVLYKSRTASLVLDGVGENGHRLPKPETQYEMYCKRLASRKGAAQALGYLQGWSTQQKLDQAALTPDQDRQEDDSYLNPPPPPPSPFPLRDNDKSSPGVEFPLFREDSL